MPHMPKIEMCYNRNLGSDEMIYDVIIIGGGPAGLMSASVFEENQLNYLLLEKNDKVGKKILLTGGKKCNVTNNLSNDQFIQALNVKHKRFLYKALSEFGPKEIINYFKQQGLELVLQENFKYFPKTMKSASVLEVFLNQINRERIKFNHGVKSIERMGDNYLIKTSNDAFVSKNVIISTGSNAYPTTGSSGDGLAFAKKLDMKTIPFSPAETYVYSKQVVSQYGDFQGVSFNTTLKIVGSKKTFEGGLLFTHFGLSGPLILHASELFHEHITHEGSLKVSIILSELSKEEVINQFNEAVDKNELLLKTLEQVTTKKVSKRIMEDLNLSNLKLKEISKKDLNKLIAYLTDFQVEIDRVEDKEKAFVNAGGIDTKELDPSTFESRKHQGLYFVGETVDLQGPIGGFNITIALTTSRLASYSIVKKINR